MLLHVTFGVVLLFSEKKRGKVADLPPTFFRHSGVKRTKIASKKQLIYKKAQLKYMGKKQRNPNKRLPPPPPKDKTARQADVDRLHKQLIEANLADDLGKATNIFELMEKYVETGESESGTIPIPDYKRTLDYIFTTKANLHSSLKLRYIG